MSLLQRLGEKLSGTYRVDRELAPGGMSRIFLAEELALGRMVVVKVLPPDYEGGVSSERFSREIRLAANLQQANIVPLLSFGEIEGLPYYTMPYVSGESLRTRLSTSGPIPVSNSLGILRDIARALTYAHEHGIVHRDIKPENVLLSGDAAVVTDFGIAKAINLSLGAHDQALTMTGTTVGTPAYIAPEQAAGDPATDHRADFYSFGCLAYELFTGHPPFFGRTPQAILAAHMTEVPKPVEAVAPEVPEHVARLIDRCLSKSAADRPHSGREILEVLDAVQSPHRLASTRKPAIAWRVAAGVSALIFVLAIAYAATRRAPRESASIASPHGKAVAVLPFTNAGGDSTEAYFAEGMADELIAALGKVPVLSVASRRSAFALRQRSDLDVPAIGRLLHVDAILEGTVRRSGDRLRVTAQLTSTGDGLSLWSERYERNVKDVFAVQDDITHSIVSALQLKLGTGARQPTTNLGAYDDFLRGSYALEQRGPGVFQSVNLFNSAIRKDSSFARAYGKLSEALEFLPYFAGVAAPKVEQRAIAAAEKALALDPSTAEAHIGLALAKGHAFKWEESDREFRLAIAADTNNASARTQYGRQLLSEARLPEAIEQLQRAVVLDPLSGTQVGWLAFAHALNGELPLALGALAIAREKFGGLDLVRQTSALEFLVAGRYSEAMQLARTFSSSEGFRGQACYVFGKGGDRVESAAMIAGLVDQPDTTWLKHTALAYCYFGIGDNDKALRQMDLAFDAREITPKWIPFGDPLYDGVRGDPRFAKIVHKFGLDEKLFIPPNRGRPGK